jgi:hypothetical protein
MEEQSNVYSEKKLASYETIYKEGVFSKPQDINITVTAAHLYGLAYICDQKGTKEGDPEYTRFVCGLDEITKVYVNNNNRNSPIYIQCDDTSKGVMNRRRIILPSFKNNEEIIKIINSSKADFDKKNTSKPTVKTDAERAKEREQLKAAADREFEELTAGYSKPKKEAVPEKPLPKDDFTLTDIMGGLDDIAPAETHEKAESVKPEEPEEIVQKTEKPKKAANDIDDIFENIPEIPRAKVEEEIKEEPAKSTPVDDFFEELVLPEDAELPDAETVEDHGYVPDDSFDEIESDDIDTEEITEPEIVTESKVEHSHAAPTVHEAPHKSEFSGGDMYVKSMYSSAENNAPAEKKPEPEKVPETQEKVQAEEKKESKAKPELDIPSDGKMSLEDFQTAVKKLKTMLDEGILSADEFAAEKSRLLKFLY